MTDIIGTDSTNFRTLPGAEKATSGHTYVVADPSAQTEDDGKGWKTAGREERQIEEHLPAPTGIDRPPNERSSVAASAGEKLSGGHGQSLQGNTSSSTTETSQPAKNVQRPSGAQMGELDQAASSLLSNGGANSANYRNPEFEPRTSINPSAKAGDTLPGSGLPALSDPVYNENARAARPTAAETLNGADSRQLHDGIGHPGAGQTSAELHHDGQTHRKKQGQGTDQYGPGGREGEEPTQRRLE